MGVDISAEVYEVSDLLEAIVERVGTTPERKIPPHEFLPMVLSNMKALVGTKAIIICNEYYDDYNPTWIFAKVIHKYYEFESGYVGEWLYDVPSQTIPGGADEYEIAEELGVELMELDDQE